MRITSVQALEDFTLILEFNYVEHRILFVKEFLRLDNGKLAEIRDDLSVFLKVTLDEIAGTICWDEVDFDPQVLYFESKQIRI